MKTSLDRNRYGSFEEFLGDLRKVDWTVAKRAHQEVESVLSRLQSDRSALSDAVNSWQTGGDLRISRATSTHLKWFVHEEPDRRFALWLHQYKPASERGDRHAVIPHNHRYWFSSLLLEGGFTSRSYVPQSENGQPVPRDRLTVTAGDVFTISPDEIHALETIEDKTLTLIVQGRPVREYSEVYELNSGEITRYYAMDALLPELKDSV